MNLNIMRTRLTRIEQKGVHASRSRAKWDAELNSEIRTTRRSPLQQKKRTRACLALRESIGAALSAMKDVKINE